MAGAVVVGYDASGCASAALETALAISARTGDRIVITFGYEPGNYGEEHSAHREEVRKFGERACGGALERAREAGAEATLELVPERPVDALLAMAEEHDAWAIIVGTRGEGPFRAAVVGSVPHKLLQVSERPVLVVPIPDA